MNRKLLIIDVVLIALCVFFTIGAAIIFKGCGIHEDGAPACYDEWQILIGLGGVLIVESLLHIVFKKPETKQGIALAVIPTALFAPIIVNKLGTLCMMPDMHCNAVMKPAVTVLGIIIAAFAVIDAAIQFFAARKAGK